MVPVNADTINLREELEAKYLGINAAGQAWEVHYTQGFVPLPRADLNFADATGRPAGTCTAYHPTRKVCELAGYCPSRDRKDRTRCTTRGKAAWCAVALRGTLKNLTNSKERP